VSEKDMLHLCSSLYWWRAWSWSVCLVMCAGLWFSEM